MTRNKGSLSEKVPEKQHLIPRIAAGAKIAQWRIVEAVTRSIRIDALLCLYLEWMHVKILIWGWKGQRNKPCWPEVDWVISQAGQPEAYFDNLTGLQNWIGQTFGRAKDHGSAWVTRNKKGESPGKWRLIKIGIKRPAIFYGEKQIPLMNWKNQMFARAKE
jgi:hypothetical protein